MLLAFSVKADDADLLREAEARRAIAAQQAERDVRDARDESYKTARTQPAKALDRLRGLLLRVENDPELHGRSTQRPHFAVEAGPCRASEK